MKKALAFLSALALGSSSESDDFLAYYKPKAQTLPYRKPYASNTFFADDEQYAGFNLVKNWHYPLKPLPMNTPVVPSIAQNEPKFDDEIEEDALFDLGQILKHLFKAQKKEQPAPAPEPTKQSHPNSLPETPESESQSSPHKKNPIPMGNLRVYWGPSEVKREDQHE